jgi:A/G-specific adenine glycosylase
MNAERLQGRILDWYRAGARDLPWRRPPGSLAPVDPYRVWLSEVMLQQTTVAHATPYFHAFLGRWPTVTALADAEDSEVMAAWAGLGYYARARNLLACARAVRDRFQGRFPETEAGLLSLPGVGPYTAAAVAAIAFGEPANVVDGNVERVMARLFAVTDPLPHSKAQLKDLAAKLTPEKRAGDYAQGVMDLGATVCTPKSPSCVICPWTAVCMARKQGIAETLPRKVKKADSPLRHGVAYWMVRADGCVALRRRPPKGLLGGMTEVPGSDWRAKKWTADDAAKAAPIDAKWKPLPGLVLHTFTHFRLEVTVWAADLTKAQTAKLGDDIIWTPLERIGQAGLPSVMAKMAKHAMGKV